MNTNWTYTHLVTLLEERHCRTCGTVTRLINEDWLLVAEHKRNGSRWERALSPSEPTPTGLDLDALPQRKRTLIRSVPRCAECVTAPEEGSGQLELFTPPEARTTEEDLDALLGLTTGETE